MNDDTIDSMINSISALALNIPEVSNGAQDDFNNLISKVVKQQKDNVALEKVKVEQEKIARMDTLKSIGSIRSAIGATRIDTVVSRPYGYSTTIANEISTNQSYFDSLREKPYSDKTSKTIKMAKGSNLNVKTLVADLLKFCSDEEIDELIACITSDSEYLSRKGYNSINLKGD